MELTTETIESNYNLFIKILKKYHLYTEKFEQDIKFNQKLKLAKFSETDVDGSLINTIFKIASYCKNINEILPKEKQVSSESLTKVCFLYEISKSEGEFEQTMTNSLYICNKYGIELSKPEFLSIENAKYAYLDDSENIARIIFMANVLLEIEK